MTILDQPWQSTPKFLKNNQVPVTANISYYGETNLCVPRIFFDTTDNAWEYRFALITVNFIAFMIIAVSYIAMYYISKKQRAKFLAKNKKQAKQDATMRRRIALVIATDFCCWIPICLMAYLSLSGTPVRYHLYLISTTLLVPINSAINPLLFSPIIGILKRFCCCFCCKKKTLELKSRKQHKETAICSR